MAKATVYLLSDSCDFCPESEENYQSKPGWPTPSVLYAPERRPRKIGAVRKRLLDSIVTYLYSRAQKVRTAEERDSFTLALAIVGAVRRGDPDPLESASYEAFGSTFKIYLKRRARQQWFYHSEFVKLIPDYDPQEAVRANVVEKSEIRRQPSNGGAVYEMPQPAQPAQQEPLRRLPQKSTKVISSTTG